jgi:hypothetical protein
MTKSVVGRFGRLALWFAPIPVVAIGFLAVLRWLKPHNATFPLVLSAVVMIFVMGYASFLGKKESRRWDEVQLAGYGFASVHGGGWGYLATMLLLMVPPVMNWLVDMVNAVPNQMSAVLNLPGSVPTAMSNQITVRLALFTGITLVMVMQGLGFVVATVVWWRHMGRTGQQS